MKIALIQFTVTADKQDNLTRAAETIRTAAANGADMAVLPEMFCCPYQNSCFRPYGEEAGGPAWQMLSAAAAETGIYVVGGSIPELEADLGITIFQRSTKGMVLTPLIYDLNILQIKLFDQRIQEDASFSDRFQ